MAFKWTDKIDGIDDVLAKDMNDIAAEIIRLNKDKVNLNLDNVTSENFRAKAEEAGVGGGTSGAMVFKDIVSELPETANEGEVYKAPVNEYKWIFKTDIPVGNADIIIYDSGIEGYFDDLTFFDNADLHNLTGIIKIETPTDNVIFDVTSASTSYSPDSGYFFVMFGECLYRTTDQIILSLASECKLYTGENINVLKTLVRHNGKWVEISKDGVTKAEMESYIEETLLGGEW
jgi:hypothetical protein